MFWVFGEYRKRQSDIQEKQLARQRLTSGSDELIATGIEWPRKRHTNSNSSFAAA